MAFRDPSTILADLVIPMALRGDALAGSECSRRAGHLRARPHKKTAPVVGVRVHLIRTEATAQPWRSDD